MGVSAATLRRAALVVPPVAVAVAVALLLARGADDRARARAEEDVRARWLAPAEFAALERDVDRYLAAHGDATESRWFAAEAFARMGRFGRAHDTVWETPAVASRPETPGRFARLLLERLPEVPGAPNRLRARTLVARVEGDAPGGREALDALVRSPDLSAEFRLLYESAAVAGRGARTALAEALGERPEEEFRLAAANLSAGPRRREAIDLLTRAASDPAVRAQPGLPEQVVRALGGTTDPRAMDALRSLRDRGGGDAATRLADLGLAVGGDPEGRARLARALEDGRLSDGEAALWAAGLGVRLAQGDEAAVADLLFLWERSPGIRTRAWLASVTLLADDPVPTAIPADRWADDLRRSNDPYLRAIADAYAWRTTGATAALDALVAAERDALRDPEATSPHAHGLAGSSAVLLEVLRAWVRWPFPRA